MVDISWINEQIAISGAFLDEDIPYLKGKGIDAIIDVRSEYCDNSQLIEKTGMRFLHIPVDDRYSPALEQLQGLFNFVEPILDEGKKVLVESRDA